VSRAVPRFDAARHGRLPRLTAGVLAASLAVSLFAGCREEPEVANAAIAAAVHAPPVEVTEGASAGVLDSDEPVVDAAQLRLMLEQLLGEHVLLMAGAAADHAAGSTTDQALAVVADNTDALTDAIGLVYGDVGARAFASLWSQHVAFFLDHARGTAEGDPQAVAEAAGHLAHYEQGFGSFTETATGGALPMEAVAQLLNVHVADINGYVDAHLTDDTDLAASRLAAGHDYAADIGATLAAAIAGQGAAAFPGATADERTQVAAELARALANHLAVLAVGAEAGGEPGGRAGEPGGGAETDAGSSAGTDGEQVASAAAAAGARLDAAVRAAAGDPTAASAALSRLTTTPVGARADADALAAALGVPDLGETLATIVTAPAGDPTAAGLIDAHRAAYALAAAWLG
jgi:hypothetical protein